MENDAMRIYSNHYKANQDSWCLETFQCSCSQCKSEADFGCFTIDDGPVNANSGSSKRLNHERPKTVNFPDGHRCTRFPCPICNPGRSRREGMPQMLKQYPQVDPVVFMEMVATPAAGFLVQPVTQGVPLFK